MSTNYFTGDILKKVIIDVGEDIGDATSVKIKYKKPNNAVGVWDAVVEDDDESISHSLDSTDLDIPGLWKIQPYVEQISPNWIGHEYPQFMMVYPNVGTVYLPPTSTSIYQNLNITYSRKVFSCDGARTTFTLDSTAKSNSIFVFINGVLLQETVDYTINSAYTILTTTIAYDAGWLLEVQYANAVTDDLGTEYINVILEFGRTVFTADGMLTSFSTANTFRATSLSVYVNGILAQKDVEYTEDTSLTGFTFTTAPESGYIIEARYLKE